MFANRYFGPRYFADRYFGNGGTSTPPLPPIYVIDDDAGLPTRHRRRTRDDVHREERKAIHEALLKALRRIEGEVPAPDDPPTKADPVLPHARRVEVARAAQIELDVEGIVESLSGLEKILTEMLNAAAREADEDEDLLLLMH